MKSLENNYCQDLNKKLMEFDIQLYTLSSYFHNDSYYEYDDIFLDLSQKIWRCYEFIENDLIFKNI